MVGLLLGCPVVWAQESKDSFKAVSSDTADYVETVSGLNLQMVYVAGGSFEMGATPEQGSDVYADETPVHTVTLNDYYIGRYEVTQAQWVAVMGRDVVQQRNDKDSTYTLHGIGADYPAYYISWDEARRFCERLSELTGKKYRLPTEAEWEYAARGGTETPYFFTGNPKDFSDQGFWRKFFDAKTDSIGSYVIYSKNSKNKTQEPDLVKANPFGLKNMLGNVMEYCADKYDPEAYAKSGSSATDPLVTEGTEWVVRGGNYTSDAADLRCASRDYTKHEAWLKTDPQQPKSIWWYSDIRGIGFRVVCEPNK